MRPIDDWIRAVEQNRPRRRDDSLASMPTRRDAG
jgi:hypothetical protein